MAKCEDCKWAYKANSSDYVMCAYWQKEWEKSKKPIEVFERKLPGNLSIAIGCASRKRPNKINEDSLPIDDTLYVNQLLVEKVCVCKYYK